MAIAVESAVSRLLRKAFADISGDRREECVANDLRRCLDEPFQGQRWVFVPASVDMLLSELRERSGDGLDLLLDNRPYLNRLSSWDTDHVQAGNRYNERPVLVLGDRESAIVDSKHSKVNGLSDWKCIAGSQSLNEKRVDVLLGVALTCGFRAVRWDEPPAASR